MSKDTAALPLVYNVAMDSPLDLLFRPRRLRMQTTMRQMLQRVSLRTSDFILPVFVRDGQNIRLEVPSMPGVFQMSIDVALKWLEQRAAEGFKAYLAFGVIDAALKDASGSEALNGNNVVCRLLQEMRKHHPSMIGMTDLCFCEYTDHGHCGPLTHDQATVANDAAVSALVKQAINHARAGAAVIAPSGMMDGCVQALREGLDEAGFEDVALLAYSVKYASAFYGPFRDAAQSAPAFGDRRSYQMDPARGVDEALLEAALDIEQGADMIMVKPAGPYLDVISAVRRSVQVPVVAYQVSGEYAMLEAAIGHGWLDRERSVTESLLAIKRAGADLIISYYGELLGRLLKR